MNEHGYIRLVHKQLPLGLYRWKINDNFTGGVADAFYSGNHGLLFVEYKYLNEKKIPKKGKTMIVPCLSSLQIQWLRDRYHNFKRVKQAEIIVILGTPTGSVLFTHLAWETGIPKEVLSDYAVTAKYMAGTIANHCLKDSHNVTQNDKAYYYPN